MKETELRIGNLVKFYDEGGEIVHITGIYKSNGSWFVDYWFDCTGVKGSSLLQEFEQIPITEEWLLKFGFKVSPAGNSIYLPVPELKAEIHFEGFMKKLVCVLYCSTGSFIPNNIQHIHQLQNLYFALTGEELVCQKL